MKYPRSKRIMQNLGYTVKGESEHGTWFEAPEGETPELAKMALSGLRRKLRGASLRMRAKGGKLYVFVGEKGGDKKTKMEDQVSKLDQLIQEMRGEDDLEEARRSKKNVMIMTIGQDLQSLGKMVRDLSKFTSLPAASGGDRAVKRLQQEGLDALRAVQKWAYKLDEAVRG